MVRATQEIAYELLEEDASHDRVVLVTRPAWVREGCARHTGSWVCARHTTTVGLCLPVTRPPWVFELISAKVLIACFWRIHKCSTITNMSQSCSNFHCTEASNQHCR